MFRTAAALLALTVLIAAAPARAITAGDVVDKMDPPARSSFLGGAVDMASYHYARTGKQQKADCVVQWFFRTDGALREVLGVFGNYKEHEAVALLDVLMNRHCGE